MRRMKTGLAVVVSALVLSACADNLESLSLKTLSPHSGKAGTVVEVRGSGFLSGMEICFNDKCAKAAVSTSDRASVPAPEGTGTVDICVRHMDDKSCLFNAFSYIEDTGETCDYTDSKCTPDLKGILTCAGGVETMTSCPYGCENGRCAPKPADPTGCSYTGSKCADDGKSLMTCTDGKETSMLCEFGCSDGKCSENPAKCDYTGSKCSADGKTLLTCAGGTETAQNCADGCVDGKCAESSGCDYTGSKCSADGRKLLTCADGREISADCAYGCSDGKCSERPASFDVVSITGMMPTSGKAGTEVTITGQNLSKTGKVCFFNNCVAPRLKSGSKIIAEAPKGEKIVDVTVEQGEDKLKAGTFTYLEEAPDVVDWCQISYYQSYIQEGSELSAYAQVYEDGVTGAGGTHDEITGQIGYIAADDKDAGDVNKYIWTDAVRNGNFSAPGSDRNDEYMTRGIILEPGRYKIAYRFTLDGGNMLYCDTDGSGNGFDSDAAASVTVDKKPVREVNWCRIAGPEGPIETVGTETEFIYAQGRVDGCSHYHNHCPILKVQIGYGSPALSVPEEIGASYKWKDAYINMNYDGSYGKNNEEFMAKLSSDVSGIYNIVARMTADGGKTWVYCDTKDDIGFSASDGITWHHRTRADAEPAKPAVDWCRIQSPLTINAAEGGDAETIYGRVHVPDCTGNDEKCAGIRAEVGYGAPDADVESYTYTKASYNAGARSNLTDIGNNDEYMAAVDIPAAGKYSYVYRFTLDDGRNWTYCDTRGATADGKVVFDKKDAGTMTVVVPEKKKIEWCRIVNGVTSSEIPVGATADAVYAQAYVAGCTNYKTHCGNLRAQAGIGPAGAAEAEITGSDKFTWVDADYHKGFSPADDNSKNNDEFVSTFTPSKVGKYAVYYRMSLDDGATWRYCDTAGGDAFDPGAAFSIDVKVPDERRIGWCQLKNSDVTIKAGTVKDAPVITGEVFINGCTDSSSGSCKGVSGYAAYGKIKPGMTAEDISREWTFSSANFKEKVNDNHSYQAHITASEDEIGEYGLVFAFSLDGGRTMTLCSASDSTEFDPAAVGRLKIEKRFNEKNFTCGLDEADAETKAAAGTPKDIWGHIWIKDCTGGQGTGCGKVKNASLYYIPASESAEHPLTEGAKFWTPVQAQINNANNTSPNDHYSASVTFAAPGSYHYAYGYDLVYDETDPDEIPQEVFCYVGWKPENPVYGTASVTEK